MKPVEFEQANRTLGRPDSMSDDECVSLPAFKGTLNGFPVFISCWEMNSEELLRVLETKKVWLYTYAHDHAPVALDVKNPFSKKEQE